MIAMAKTVDDLSAALKTVRERDPVLATSDPAELIDHLNGLLDGWRATARRAA